MDPTTAFDLSRAVTLSIADAVAEMTSGAVQPALKWPNDLYHEGQKLGGILIENRWGGEGLEWSVIGLGLNINQTTFEPGLRATSLKLILGQTIPLPYCAEVVQKHLEVALDSLDSIHSLRQAYEDRLLGKGIPGKFQKPGQETFAGIILGTTPDGRLRLQPETGPERQYEVKEVQQLFS